MAPTRSIPKTAPITGSSHVETVSDTVGKLAEYLAGNAISPTGTNALQFTIGLMAGLSGIPDGMELALIPVAANTGPVTFEITGTGTGTKSARNADGTAFTGGELVAGTAYTFRFWGGAIDHWRIVGSARTADTGSKYPLTYVEAFTTPGAWSFTAPWDCDVMANIAGAGGSGFTNGSGGAAGGFCKKFLSMKQGEILSGAIGTGGVGGGASNPGTSTTLSSSSPFVSMTASGGSAGVFSGSVAGGAASGGDVNYTGGGATSTNKGGGAIGLIANGVASTNTSGAYAISPTSPVALSPFDKAVIKGGTSILSNGQASESGVFGCGGGAGVNNSSFVVPNGAGGNGFVIIQYSPDKSA